MGRVEALVVFRVLALPSISFIKDCCSAGNRYFIIVVVVYLTISGLLSSPASQCWELTWTLASRTDCATVTGKLWPPFVNVLHFARI